MSDPLDFFYFPLSLPTFPVAAPGNPHVHSKTARERGRGKLEHEECESVLHNVQWIERERERERESDEESTSARPAGKREREERERRPK